MTKIQKLQKKYTSIFLRGLYKTIIFLYSFYMVFSSHVFALQAEAPLKVSSLSFGEVQIHTEEKTVIIDDRVQKIENYFNRYHLPLAKEARWFVESADRYGIDWRLLASIGMIESTGGKFACKKVSYNAFGWGSCKYGFDSYKEAIDIISKNLAGKNPKTAHYYAHKDTRGILEAYNPPSVVPDYADKVMREMDRMARM